MKRTWLSVPVVVFALVVAWEGSGRGEPLSSNSLTGVEWRVSELSGHAVASSVDRQQPFIIFDDVKKQVTGYAGCNRFFGGYELEGEALRFGPIGATKRGHAPILRRASKRKCLRSSMPPVAGGSSMGYSSC